MNASNVLLTGSSSLFSAAFPSGTFPRLVMFLSNLEVLLAILRGSGWLTVEVHRRGIGAM